MAEPVALGVQVPDSFKTIGSMLNMANSAQNLQRGNVELQQNQIKLQERKAVQDYFSNPSKFVDKDGKWDYNAFIEGGMTAAPTLFPTMMPQIITAHKAGVEAEQALNSLNNAQRKASGEFILTLRDDDPATAFKKIDALSGMSKELRTANDFFKNHILIPAAQQGPEAWKKAVFQVGNMVTPVSEQRTAMTPDYVSTGGELKNKNPMATGAPQSIPMTVPPTSRETVVEGTDKNPYILKKNLTGNITGTSPLASAGGAAQPSNTPAPPVSMPYVSPEDQATRPVLEGERNQARVAFRDAPDLRNSVRGVLDEIDKVSATGQAGPFFQRINSVLGGALDWTTKEKTASSFDLVGKYLERLALQQAQSMGPHTNAGLESVKAASGTTAYNPTAIKEIARLIDANVAGMQAYQPGLEKAIEANPQRGALVKREFDQAWGKNYDPRIMQINNASAAGDKETIDKIIRSVGGKGSAGARELIQKARNIEALSTNGRL